VNILVNNAGIAPDGRALADMDPKSFDRMIAINLTGVFNGISTFASGMRDRGVGHIVNIAAIGGLFANGVNFGAYTAAKFAVVGMSEMLRAELAPRGVGVSVVCPGLVKSRLHETTRAMGGEVMETAQNSQSRMDAAIVGAMVVAAIRKNELYVLTHAEYRSRFAQRSAAVMQAFGSVLGHYQAFEELDGRAPAD
jgi:NAD(P)-dependent dehydrogenase (short-subunit alcohol dehydrogenase family)